MARLGEIIDGKYEVLREVGRGGMSVVYLAMDKRLNKQWAIKEFRKDKDDASKQVALKALLDEANLMKKLDHPTLPRIVDIIENNQNVYVIMDYIEGESLNKVLDAYGAQPQEAVIEWAKQLSDVLDYLHTQQPPVIYRDMKPANIMLKPDGTVRLIDFGIAREYKEGKEGDTEAIGTRGYAAPEQFGGRGQTDARTDIYSLGVTLYHLVTGKNPAEPPYEIYPIRHWNPSFSSGLEWLIQKCTQLNPGDRYQSCAEVTYVLENLDKFDVEYKKKKKTRFNLFLVSLIMTVVFTIASVGSFFGSATMKSNSYDTLLEQGKYIEAMDVDENNITAYEELSEHLYNTVTKISNDSGGEEKDKTVIEAEITVGDLMNWFPTDIMNEFKTSNPAEYARIQFRIGYLFWVNFDAGKGGDQSLAFQKAKPYFQEVLDVAMDGTAGGTAGLTESQFNLVKVIYSASFFQTNKNLSGNMAGDTAKLTEIEKFAGIDVDTFDKDAYRAYWNTLEKLLDVVGNKDEDMTFAIKYKTLEKIYVILDSEYESFIKEAKTTVTPKEMNNAVKKFAAALKALPDSFEDEKESLKTNLNITIRRIVAEYNGQNLNGAEVEAIA